MGRKLFDRCIRCKKWTIFGLRKFYRCPSCNLPFCNRCVDQRVLGLFGYDCPHCNRHLPRNQLKELVDHR